MKNITLLTLFFSLLLSAQPNNQTGNTSEKDIDYKKEYFEQKKILKEVNETFLTTAFVNKYTEAYFSQIFEPIDASEKNKMENSDVIIKSIMTTEEPSSDLYKLAIRARDFNINYRLLENSLNQKILDKKYDEEVVTNAISELEKAPKLKENIGLEFEKNRLISLYSEYPVQNCIAKNEFESMHEIMLGFEGKEIKDKNSLYQLLNKYNKTKQEYTFLSNVFNELKSDLKNYDKQQYQLPDTCTPIKVEVVEEVIEDLSKENVEVVKEKEITEGKLYSIGNIDQDDNTIQKKKDGKPESKKKDSKSGKKKK